MLRVVVLLATLVGCGRLGFGSGDDTVRDSSVDTDGMVDSITTDGPDAGAMTGQPAQQSAIGFTTGPQTMTLPAPSTAGTLLVMTFAANSIASLTLPGGWIMGPNQFTNGSCAAAIYYLPNNPGGITSVMFSQPALQPTVAHLTEWSGIAATNPLDAVGTTNGMNSMTMQTVTTTTATTVANEVAITVFCEDVAMPTYTSGTGWTSLGTSSNGSAEPSFSSSYQIVSTPGIATETQTSNVSGKHSAAIATFRPQ